jgi:hypothetical protein
MTNPLALIWWFLESQWWVPFEHAAMLERCAEAGSVTARIISIYAPLMCFPQWLGPLFFFWSFEVWAVFAARCAAMCIVRKLDGFIPYTRALGLCHLLTFGPLFWWFWFFRFPYSSGDASVLAWFMWAELLVIAVCLIQDTRDLVLHVMGFPFPCYIRVGVRAGKIKVSDPRARAPVTWRHQLIGP